VAPGAGCEGEPAEGGLREERQHQVLQLAGQLEEGGWVEGGPEGGGRAERRSTESSSSVNMTIGTQRIYNV
jgi:hypothetical protein